MSVSDFEDEPDNEEPDRPRDEVIDEARVAVADFISDKRDDVFYLKQLQVSFEKKFYHWITAKAVGELVADGTLRDRREVLHEASEGGQATPLRFIFHPSNRYTTRLIRKKIGLIRRFSAEAVGRACGRQAEMLFSRAMFAKGFRFVSENTSTYRDKTWTETGHDLDFIFEQDEIAYGCEIKNRFEYIDRAEMRTKIAMCQALDLTPLFILRSAPKSYIHEIWLSRGFTKIFSTHIFSYGSEALVEEIRSELPGMPVDCPRDLPDTILDTFVHAHIKRIRAV